MSIYGIGSLGFDSIFQYQNAVGRVRLGQALSQNPKVQAVRRLQGIDESVKSSAIDFVKDYNSVMSDVMSKANVVRKSNSSSVSKDLEVASSDTAVAEAKERYPLRAGESLSLEVEQLAASQQNTSGAVDAQTAAEGNMDFILKGKAGEVQVQVSAQNDNGTQKTNRQMLEEAARQINNSQAGVGASVSEKDGKVSLVLTGKDTGASHAFTVSGEMGAAAGAETASREAQNAAYTVTQDNRTRNYTSESNDVRLDAGRIDATLKGTGKTTIAAKPDADKIVSAVSDLVDSYNKAQNFLDSNMSHGTGVVSQAESFGRSLIASSSMERIGITKDKEGNLVLDKDALKKALEKEPEQTLDRISGSYGLGQAAFNKASGAMGVNSSSLINADLEGMGQHSSNSFNFMSLYSRNNSFNMMSDYYMLGMMVNYKV